MTTTQYISYTDPSILRAEAQRLRTEHQPNMPVSQSNLCRADDLEAWALEVERFYEGLSDWLSAAWPELGHEYCEAA